MQFVPIEFSPENLSGMFGSISIACWVIVFVPQIYENFYRKSAEGLSLLFVVLWLAGDVFNLLGAMMQHLLPTMIVLAAYYTVADIILWAQCLWYDNEKKVDPIHLSPANPMNENVLQDVFNERQPLLSNGQASNLLDVNEDSRTRAIDTLIEIEEEQDELSQSNNLYNCFIVLCVVLAGFISWYVTYCSKMSNGGNDHKIPVKPRPVEVNVLAQMFGYLSAALYLGSRIPQILLNFKRKSCEGISFLFFLFACIGNITFILSVLVISSDPTYLMVNASWLLGSSGTLVMDFVIFGQFFSYGVGKSVSLDSQV
ncbi:similar to Saccharomyces cerevisiae YBR147W RTC2 Protein of unknown function [Maudiozyma barnettii]|uniref:Uncharacterized protein n=1 Tax=Maudiozyma barnettii TaxID=61262 RepID=A0A8H2VJQ5_9SACH|nr:uncharacterized protein KABA2_10S03278 [Kazachstania barnettii]CAB4256615.1 similar to Saccharomyces cerevisiae YBR147W RTC2 Protein of unknown function [Kazachstania barnettii]CAD1785218.1 similar to Saccharomyces cerevisiae YBR147W RTC2 Protein of unknown function [Kazachstania barnettii]